MYYNILSYSFQNLYNFNGKKNQQTSRDARTKLMDTLDSSLVLLNSKLLSLNLLKALQNNMLCIVTIQKKRKGYKYLEEDKPRPTSTTDAAKL